MRRGAAEPARWRAAALLVDWRLHGVPADRLLEGVDRDRPFITEVVLGAMRWHRSLDFIRAHLAQRPPASRIEGVLLAGLYELLWMDNIQPYAVVDDLVEAAKVGSGVGAGRFVNALLRRADREREDLRRLLSAQSPAVRWSHPDILADRWRARFGEAAASALMRWDNERPLLALRVDRRRASVEKVLEAFRVAGVEAGPHPARPDDFIELAGGAAPQRLPGFAEGWFAVQDPATMASVDLLDPKPGERVLDVCAAPGGKTLAMAERLGGAGELLALDVDDERLARVRENAARLCYPWIRTRSANLVNTPAALAGQSFEAVLLDVPCTNTGVLRRRPDARWRFDAQRLAGACATQRAILDAAAAYVRPGGRLVYSTCSLEPEENGEQIRAWLERNPSFALAGERELIPPSSSTDGAYAARLERARP